METTGSLASSAVLTKKVIPKMTCRSILFLFLSSLVINVLGNLEQVNDVELEKLIANEKFVITLFRGGKVYFTFLK
jgi:hypothetical protein